jgi:hypothetical protein
MTEGRLDHLAAQFIHPRSVAAGTREGIQVDLARKFGRDLKGEWLRCPRTTKDAEPSRGGG